MSDDVNDVVNQALALAYEMQGELEGEDLSAAQRETWATARSILKRCAHEIRDLREGPQWRHAATIASLLEEAAELCRQTPDELARWAVAEWLGIEIGRDSAESIALTSKIAARALARQQKRRQLRLPYVVAELMKRPYICDFNPGDVGGSFQAECPELSFCFVTGDNEDQVAMRLEVAKELWFTEALLFGMGIPRPRATSALSDQQGRFLQLLDSALREMPPEDVSGILVEIAQALEEAEDPRGAELFQALQDRRREV